MPQPSPYDALADALVDWIEEASDWLADALKSGGSAPFAADATQEEKLRYYDRQFFTPDGQPNVAGRQRELERLGAKGYAQAMRTVMQRRQQGLGSVSTNLIGP